MGENFEASKQLQVIKEPVEFRVSLIRASSKAAVGLELDTVGGKCAMVTKILDGVVKNYNKAALENERILVGDVIMQVNTVKDDTKLMGRETMQATTLDFLLRRPAEFTISIDKST